MEVIQYTDSRDHECYEWTSRVFQFIEREKSYFKIVAIIVTTFNHFEIHQNGEIKRYVELLVMADPKLKGRDDEEKKTFIQLIVDLYNIDSQKDFDNYRANIVEEFVWRNGPFLLQSISYERHKEPILKTPEGDLIGQSDGRIDVIFHSLVQEIDHHVGEYIECKVRLDNFISVDEFDKLRQRQKNKLKYLQDVWNYFNAFQCQPILAIACLNGNVSLFRKRLNDWGFAFLKIYNRDVLLERIS